jgi:HSP20 family protein
VVFLNLGVQELRTMSSKDTDKDRWKKDSPLNSDDIEDILDEMERIFGESNFREILEEMMRGRAGLGNNQFIRGFSLHIGPNGKPEIQEFGNQVKKTPTGAPVISEEREPVTDILENSSHVFITIELPGVERSDIDLKAKAQTVEISVDAPARKYHKVIELPCRARPRTAQATYRNGILDISVEKSHGEEREEFRIQTK